ncbi:MAG: choice-of-anchor X domain-containing protein, partial [Candidatus Eisenbacteria bacterium]
MLERAVRAVVGCVACAVGAAMLVPVNAQAAPEVALATAEPTQILVGKPTRVLFSADIADPTFIPGGANLLQVGAPGTNPTIAGVLRDDGTGGDEIAGDGRYSLEVTLNEPVTKQLTFRISAAFRGQLRRVNSVDVVVSALANRPAVAIAGPDRAVPAGSVVTLDGRRSFDLDGELISFEWVLTNLPLGSGATLDDPSLVMPSFTADVAGVYRARLIVRDGKDRSAPSEVAIVAHAANTPPTAVIGGELALPFGNGPLAVASLNGAGSFDPEGSVLTNTWRLVARPASSTAPTLNPLIGGDTLLTADKPGRYRVELIVNDGSLASAPAQTTVTFYAPNTAPSVSAGSDQTVTPGTRAHLSGSANDVDVADGAPTLAWAFISRPLGSGALLQEPNTATPSF